MDYHNNTEQGWIWVIMDLRVVMDNFGFPVIVPFCAGLHEACDFDPT